MLAGMVFFFLVTAMLINVHIQNSLIPSYFKYIVPDASTFLVVSPLRDLWASINEVPRRLRSLRSRDADSEMQVLLSCGVAYWFDKDLLAAVCGGFALGELSAAMACCP